jgi:6-phosphogluconolactonase (cycloisomerase 2 family)
MRMKFCGLAVLLVGASLAVSTGCSTSATSPPPAGKGALFVATQGDTTASAFTIDLGNGKLTAKGTGVSTGDTPTAMVLSPGGDQLFIANKATGDISIFSVAADGTLSSGSTQGSGGTNPVALAMDPGGKFLFIANQGDPFATPSPQLSSISVLTLQGMTMATFAAQDDTVALAVTPGGNFLYAANRTDGTVTAYAVSSTGALTPAFGSLANSTFDVGSAPSALAITPEKDSADLHFLYVANAGSNNVSAFFICDKVAPDCLTPDGSLTEATGSPFSAGLGPSAIAITPSRKFLYVVDQQSNQISEYTIAATSGALTPISGNGSTPAPISTGLTPVSLSITPDGNYVFVANIGAASVSSFTILTDTGRLGVAQTPFLTGGQPAAVATK